MEDNFMEENNRNETQIDSTNKLLLEMVRNQKQNTQNLVKIFIATIICYTLLLIGSVIGFFIYESQFETIDGEYEVITQNADSDNEGVAIVNNGGDVSYGEGESDDSKGEDAH